MFGSKRAIDIDTDPASRGPGNGAGTRSRTRDLLITNQLLYQLSYTGIVCPPIARAILRAGAAGSKAGGATARGQRQACTAGPVSRRGS